MGTVSAVTGPAGALEVEVAASAATTSARCGRGRPHARGGPAPAAARGAPPQAGGRLAVVVLSSHPQRGGSMRGSVESHLYEDIAEDGAFVVVRFNYRGVGRSGGAKAGDVGSEHRDCEAVLDWLLGAGLGVGRILLVGYSYGCMIARSMAMLRPEVVGCVMCAPPFHMFPGELVRSSISKPQLVVVGEKDNVCLLCFGFERFKNGLTALASPAETKILNKADHYFSGCEATCSKVILDWIRDYSLVESLESVTL